MYIVKAHSLLAISKARREARKELNPVVEKVEPVVEKVVKKVPIFYSKYEENKEWYINDFVNHFYTDGVIIDLLCKRYKSGYDKEFNRLMDLEHTPSAYLDMYINNKKNGKDIIKRLGWYDTWSYKSFKENYGDKWDHIKKRPHYDDFFLCDWDDKESINKAQKWFEKFCRFY